MDFKPTDWQQRVLDERDELHCKMDRLSRFILTTEFSTLHVVDQSLMLQQLGIMKQLDGVLQQRIERFKPAG